MTSDAAWKFPIIGMAWGVPAKDTAMINVATGYGAEPDGLIEHFWIYDDGCWKALCNPELTTPPIDYFSRLALLGLFQIGDQRCAICSNRRKEMNSYLDWFEILSENESSDSAKGEQKTT